MNKKKGIVYSILAIFLGSLLLLISLTLFRIILGSGGFLIGLGLVFFGFIFLILFVLQKD
jgi:ABC-type Fe3+-siderophore transport system permease subunit